MRDEIRFYFTLFDLTTQQEEDRLLTVGEAVALRQQHPDLAVVYYSRHGFLADLNAA